MKITKLTNVSDVVDWLLEGVTEPNLGDARDYISFQVLQKLADVIKEKMAPCQGLLDAKAEIERLRVLHLECFVCKAALIEDDGPPRCMDCQVTDEMLCDWEEQLGKQKEEQARRETIRLRV